MRSARAGRFFIGQKNLITSPVCCVAYDGQVFSSGRQLRPGQKRLQIAFTDAVVASAGLQ